MKGPFNINLILAQTVEGAVTEVKIITKGLNIPGITLNDVINAAAMTKMGIFTRMHLVYAALIFLLRF